MTNVGCSYLRPGSSSVIGPRDRKDRFHSQSLFTATVPVGLVLVLVFILIISSTMLLSCYSALRIDIPPLFNKKREFSSRQPTGTPMTTPPSHRPRVPPGFRGSCAPGALWAGRLNSERALPLTRTVSERWYAAALSPGSLFD